MADERKFHGDDKKEHVYVPAYDKPGPPEGQAFGAAAVTQALDDIDFPISKEDLLRKAGDREIEWSKGETMRIRDILERSDRESFESMAGVVSAVGDAA